MEAEARESFSAAIRTARGLRDPVLLTRGALGLAGPWSALSRSDPERVALLDEALTELSEDDSPLRARLLARTSLELYYAGEPELRLSLSDEAVRIARRVGDPRTLAACLDARHYALWRPENTEERLAVAAELRDVAEEAGDPELELQGAAWTIIDLMELGDIDGVDIQIAAVSKLADALHRPIWLWWAGLFRATRALLDGRFDEAERLAQETLAIGQRGQAENALHYYAQCMYSIRREQGPPGRGRGRGAQLHRALPGDPGVAFSALALLLIELGRPDEARAEFEAAAGGGFADFPRDANWLVAITLMAEVCGALGDSVRAAELYAMLEPYAGRNVVVGRNATFNGSRLVAAGAAGGGAGAVRTGGVALRGGAGDARGHGRPAVRSADEGRVGGDAARAGGRTRGRPSCWPTRSWSPTRWGWSCWRSGPGGWCRLAVERRAGWAGREANSKRTATALVRAW